MTSELIETIPDHRILTFDGQLLEQTSTTINLGESDKRALELKLFAVRTGGFVASIEFRSADNSQLDVLVAEQIDTVNDAELVFRFFDPLQYIDERELNRSFPNADQTHAVLREVTKTYDNHVRIVLQALTNHKANNPDCEESAELEANKKQSFWQKIGLFNDSTKE